MYFDKEINELNGLSGYVEHAFKEEHAYNSFNAISRGIQALEKQEKLNSWIQEYHVQVKKGQSKLYTTKELIDILEEFNIIG